MYIRYKRDIFATVGRYCLCYDESDDRRVIHKIWLECSVSLLPAFVVAMASSSDSSRRCRNCNLCCVHDLCIFCQSNRRCNHCLRYLPDHCFRNYDIDVCEVSLKSIYLQFFFFFNFVCFSIELTSLFIHFATIVLKRFF